MTYTVVIPQIAHYLLKPQQDGRFKNKTSDWRIGVLIIHITNMMWISDQFWFTQATSEFVGKWVLSLFKILWRSQGIFLQGKQKLPSAVRDIT